MILQDDNTGHQQIVVTQSSYNGYNLQLAGGRSGCGTYISSQACGTSIYPVLVGQPNTVQQSFAISSIAGGNAPYFANGLYTIQNTERTTCDNTFGSQTCANGNAVTMQASGKLDSDSSSSSCPLLFCCTISWCILWARVPFSSGFMAVWPVPGFVHLWHVFEIEGWLLAELCILSWHSGREGSRASNRLCPFESVVAVILL